MKPKNYDSTVARIAGNLLSGTDWTERHPGHYDEIAARAVLMATAIVRQTKLAEVDVDAQRVQP